jgi:hypothetical protein
MKKENYVGKEGKKETISIIQHCSCLTGWWWCCKNTPSMWF